MGAVKLVTHNWYRLPRHELLILKVGNLEVDGWALFDLSRNIPGGKIMPHSGRNNIAGQVAPADVIKLTTDPLKLTKSHYSVGVAPIADGPDGSRTVDVQGLYKFRGHAAGFATILEILDRGVGFLSRDHTAHHLAQ